MPTFVLPNSTKRPGAKLASEQPWPFFKIALNFDSCQFWRDICICPNQIARNHHLCPIRDIVYAICRKLNGRNGFNPNQRPNMALVIGRWERNIAFLQVNVLEMIYQSCGGFIRIHNFVNIILEMNWLALQHLHFVRISYRSFDWKKKYRTTQWGPVSVKDSHILLTPFRKTMVFSIWCRFSHVSTPKYHCWSRACEQPSTWLGLKKFDLITKH